MTMLIELLTGSLLPYLVAAAGGLAVVVGAYFKGRSAGKKSEVTKRLKADKKALEDRKEIENEIANDPDSVVRDRLRNDARR